MGARSVIRPSVLLLALAIHSNAVFALASRIHGLPTDAVVSS
jgi:hypothetical protein